MKKIFFSASILALLSVVSSCVKENYNQPPAQGEDPAGIRANITIDSLYNLFYKIHPTGTTYYQIAANDTIAGVVVGDDRSGNLYKEIAIEDSTAGMMVLLNASDLYSNYPIGRRVFISLKGLFLTNFEGGMLEIAGYINTLTASATGVPETTIPQHVFPGKWGINVAPKIVTAASLDSLPKNYWSELIQLNGVEFTLTSLTKTYYYGNNGISIEDCSNHNATVYTSNYANFAYSYPPSGKGNLVAIFGTYDNTPQLTVRDTAEVQLFGPRCN